MDVIVPVYNNARYLDECLRSLIGQTVSFDRIVVVDDASTDPAVAPILRDYAERSNKVTLLTHERNMGISATQNSGLACCGSKLVAFVDCDDFIMPNAVEEVCREVTRADDPTYIFTDRAHIDADGTRLDDFTASSHYGSKRSIADALLDGMFASHLKVINRSALNAVGGFATAANGVQDWDVALKLSEVGPFLHVRQTLYSHRIHSGQNSTTDRTLNFQRTNTVRREALERRGIRGNAEAKPSRRTRALQMQVHARLTVRLGEDRDSFIHNVQDGLAIVLTDDGTGLFHMDEVLFNPEFECPVRSVMVLICAGWADLGRLRFVKGIEHAHLVFAAIDTPDSCSLAQWFNSYFETVAPLCPEAELACLGYLWHGAELLTTARHRPAPTRRRTLAKVNGHSGGADILARD